MIKTILSAAALSLMVGSMAWASPPSAGLQFTTNGDVVKVGKDSSDRDHDQFKHKWRGREAFDDDRDYRYKSWKRYSYRPYDDWEARGCVSVGPVFYCP